MQNITLRIALAFSFIFFLFVKQGNGQQTLPAKIKNTLALAGNNRAELEKVLSHYAKDPLKFKAACFLIENMEYHTSINKSVVIDTSFTRIIEITDSIYYNLVKGKRIDEIKDKQIQDSIKNISVYIQGLIGKSSFDQPEIYNSGETQALQNISAGFLIQQIENAFRLRRESSLVKKLGFIDFCEYVLPIQYVVGRNLRKSGKEFYDFFSKYLPIVTDSNITEVVKYYHLTINNFRKILGKYPFDTKIGFEEALFTGVPGWDCFDVISFDAAGLNAIGIPIIVQYNIAYKMLQGKHSECGVFEKLGHYNLFSLEGGETYPELMKENFEGYKGWMNLYRMHYAKQKDAPVFLKATEEQIPEDLSSPLIKDETALRIRTTSITLPFKEKTKNNLVYLGTFNSASETVPVTWAVIDKNNSQVIFKNVIPDRLYFPIYYEEQEQKSFSEPFYIKFDSARKEKYQIVSLGKDNASAGKKINAIVTRKFPRKPNMITVAKNLIGTVIIASNKADFSERDTLFVLNYEPQPYMQEANLNINKPYKFYRVEAPMAFHKMNLSEVQFLTKKSYGYTNIIDPAPLAILNPKDENKIDTSLTRILEGDIEKLKKIPEYDGKMTTAPGAYPFITLRLKEPQVVTTVRFAPLNADNGIVIGNEYLLRQWGNGKWENVSESQEAKYNYLYYSDLYTHKIYWLRNLTGGKEEIPFFLDDEGKQQFIYNE